MSSKKGKEATGAARQGGSGGRANRTELLNKKEFRDCFGIPNGVSIRLLEGDAMSTAKSGDNSICFSKEQFNAGLRLPLPSLFKQFLHYTQIPPALIHPNVVRVLMGCSVLDMLFSLDLSLLEVLFTYSVKKGENDIYNFVANIPSLQLVTGLPDSTKGTVGGNESGQEALATSESGWGEPG
ncbi:uncharacterized protein LOC117932996 [Vitis riparia]|uniref:uncharacterized protein LOC117932996 n=1 Tax=Vitis riparia TaxID=96939 RepID=UPI00155AE9BB|nr:uncharacterized protein LOC117932996 [Vitis riparia]